ncbi:hypothetical protein DUNSADRAFT_15005 [Dunaliella salina]|uniref:Ubiquitin-like domain-containing protein n=1 Tax=Dunaliella salina TaxID=3046 RepID=A0ABQ7G676_DUNSA|nr:hypothetical protein DUNSADRAFT_15005 [Dunaliella salina]|eukprot:KAF5830114.1 hypothetical protein DUNSADRAFT_15005 [Dunaliella salina]
MQIKHALGLPDTAYVRILCAGREMRDHDPVTLAPSAVLHVTFALEPPPPCPPSPDRSKMTNQSLQQQASAAPPSPPPQPPPTDWLDVIDPGTLLMWIFGLIISVLWLLLVFNSRMFDSTSIIILFIMTIAFLLPVALSFLPFPTFLTPHMQPWHLRGAATPAPTNQVGMHLPVCL